MKPINFKQSNCQLSDGLRAWNGLLNHGENLILPTTIICMELSEQEYKQLGKERKVWVRVTGNTVQPINLEITNPWEPIPKPEFSTDRINPTFKVKWGKFLCWLGMHKCDKPLHIEYKDVDEEVCDRCGKEYKYWDKNPLVRMILWGMLILACQITKGQDTLRLDSCLTYTPGLTLTTDRIITLPAYTFIDYQKRYYDLLEAAALWANTVGMRYMYKRSKAWMRLEKEFKKAGYKVMK